MSENKVAPFVKWAGGKRQLLDRIIERMPQQYNDYYEPFVGGGAVLFALQPKTAIINDINAALINAYQVIAQKPQAFMDCVKSFDEKIAAGGKEYYYAMREHYNDKLMQEEFDIELAALLVFINKHCFNGLYRVNGKRKPDRDMLVTLIRKISIKHSGEFTIEWNFDRKFKSVDGSYVKGAKKI